MLKFFGRLTQSAVLGIEERDTIVFSELVARSGLTRDKSGALTLRNGRHILKKGEMLGIE